jgi:DNA-binding transcriptional MerR regulator
MKRAGGRRFYRPADIATLATIRRLLHQDGYTIKGVQKLYRESGLRLTETTAATLGPAAPAVADARLISALADLEAAKARLDHALGLA